jgi:hypothetical protein
MNILKKLIVVFFVFQMGALMAQEQAAPAQAPAAGSALEADQKDDLLKGELVNEDDESDLTEDQKNRKRFNQEQEALWKNPDYKAYNKAFQDLHHLSRAFANNQFRLALSNYQAGVNIILKMRDNVENFRREEGERKRTNEKYYWQKIDRQAHEERVVHREKLKAKQNALDYFTRAIEHLDEIKNGDLKERPEFKRLLSDVYRAWTMVEYDLQNYPQCIQILELYLEIDDNEKEYPAHKYLASCYSFQENMLKKVTGAEDLMLKYRYKKNVHLLRATELRYGKDSPEYKYIVSLVNKDEVISVNP